MDLSKKQKNRISKKIGYFYEEIKLKYESKKYDEDKYAELRELFQDIGAIDEDVICEDLTDSALAWKYARTVDDLRANGQYTEVRYSLYDNWEEFKLKEWQERPSGKAIFNYWFEEVDYPISFITAAFIAHLCRPNQVPIVDQHNLRAVRYFLSDVNAENNLTQNPNTWEEIRTVKKFIRTFSADRNVSVRDLDKYLMMFGKHVAPSKDSTRTDA